MYSLNSVYFFIRFFLKIPPQGLKRSFKLSLISSKFILSGGLIQLYQTFLHSSSFLPSSFLTPSFILPSSFLHPSFILPSSFLHPSFILPSSLLHPYSILPSSFLNPSSFLHPCIWMSCIQPPSNIKILELPSLSLLSHPKNKPYKTSSFKSSIPFILHPYMQSSICILSFSRINICKT